MGNIHVLCANKYKQALISIPIERMRRIISKSQISRLLVEKLVMVVDGIQAFFKISCIFISMTTVTKEMLPES